MDLFISQLFKQLKNRRKHSISDRKSRKHLLIFLLLFLFPDCDGGHASWGFARNFQPHGQADQDLHERRPRKETLLWTSYPDSRKNEKVKKQINEILKTITILFFM